MVVPSGVIGGWETMCMVVDESLDTVEMLGSLLDPVVTEGSLGWLLVAWESLVVPGGPPCA